jgi:hypothetical protein
MPTDRTGVRQFRVQTRWSVGHSSLIPKSSTHAWQDLQSQARGFPIYRKDELVKSAQHKANRLRAGESLRPSQCPTQYDMYQRAVTSPVRRNSPVGTEFRRDALEADSGFGDTAQAECVITE